MSDDDPVPAREQPLRAAARIKEASRAVGFFMVFSVGVGGAVRGAW
jgi:hypothetical protein